MNSKKIFLILLSVIFGASTLFVSANTSVGNVSCSEIVPQQAWYTKLIKLENLKSKDVNGTLNFDLVPDNSANKKYLKSNEIDEITKEPSTVDVVPGLVNHSYKVPFSSNDYVDSKFNELAWAFGSDSEQDYALFNHAFLHEWGRIETSSNASSFFVGKLDPKQFSNPALDMTAEEQKDYYQGQIEEFKKGEYKLSWSDDPDTDGVIGWKNFFGTDYYNSEDHLYDFLGAFEFGSQLLNEYETFRNGTMDVVKDFSLNTNLAESYNLKMTTRPIAISKTYDAQGNINTIEKPLIPAKDAYNFIDKHNKKIGDYYKNKIFRYKLIETQSEGIDLPLPEKNLIVDVLAYGGKDTEIYVFENEKEADDFYHKVLNELDENIMAGEDKIQSTKKVQLINELVTYRVTHEFNVAQDSSIKEFPEAVKIEVAKQLPDEKTGKVNGEVVEPGTLKDAKDVADNGNDGKWEFIKFIDQDPATEKVDAKVDNSDVNFVGEWTFVQNKHKVTYEYKSGTQGVELPEALKKKEPSEVTSKVKGDKVTSPVPEGKDLEFRDDSNKGTWKFKEYDKKDVTIENKDEHVIGTWVFEKDLDNQKPTEKFTITIDPNGGNWNGNTTKRVKTVEKGHIFILLEAPERDGYKFLYWKGSKYQPGQEYIVQGDHTFTAEWEKDEEKPEPKKPKMKNSKEKNIDEGKSTPKTPAKVDKAPKTGDSLEVAAYAGLLAMMSMSVLLILKKKDCK